MIPASAFSLPIGFDRVTFVRRILLLFLMPNVLFAVMAIPTDAPWLIGILNGASLALSAGVCVAFLPAIASIFLTPTTLQKGDYLSLGIWITWFAVILQAGLSIVWRSEGMPMWLANTDFTSYFLFMRTCGAILHLAAPGAVDNRIPTRRWVLIGVIIAVSVVMVLLLGWMLKVVAINDLIRVSRIG